MTTVVRSDAEAFAVPSTDDIDMPERQIYEIYPGEIAQEPEGPTVLDLDYSLSLMDWSDNVVVLSADLVSTNGGASGGPYYFNEQDDLGLESVAAAGYQAAVLTDFSQQGYVCISDLDPGVAEAGAEQCGQIGDPETDALLSVAAGGDSGSVDLVDEAMSEYWSLDEGTTFSEDSEPLDSLYENEFLYSDPGLRWEIGFSSGDEEWALLDRTRDDPVLWQLSPPEGALFPVQSYI
ncbi:hypothetical protein GCM10029992_02940 [Glycomyces albus]